VSDDDDGDPQDGCLIIVGLYTLVLWAIVFVTRCL